MLAAWFIFTFCIDLLQGCVRYGTYRGIPPVYTAGTTGTGHFGNFGTTSIPAPDTSVSSIRHQYTGTGHFGKFGTTSTPVPDTSVSSVAHQYRYRTLRLVRYDTDTGTAGTATDFHAGTVHFGKFGTSILVPETSVSSVRHQRYRDCRYRTEHTLEILDEKEKTYGATINPC